MPINVQVSPQYQGVVAPAGSPQHTTVNDLNENFTSVSAIPTGFVGTARVGTDLYVGDGLSLNKSGTGILAPYLGQVATNCRLLSAYYAGFWLANCRTAHVACENLTNYQVVFPTFCNNSGSEVDFNGTVTLEATLEYPINVFTRITFGGVNKGSIAGGTNFISDAITVNIPYGTMFWIRSRLIVPNAAPNGYVTESGTGIGVGGFGLSVTSTYGTASDAGAECAEWSNSASTLTSKLTTAGLFGTQNAGLMYRPVAIIQQTRNPSYYFCGDSICNGSFDVQDVNTRNGYFERATDKAYINVGVGGESFGAIVTSPKRRDLAKYCSHVVTDYGINQVASGNATWVSNATTLVSFFPTKKVYFTTLIPQQQTSSNSWVDGGNSATPTNEVNRVAINSSIRTLAVPNSAGYVDADYIMATTFNGPYWKPSMTSDGTHPNAYGYKFIGANLKLPL